VYSNSAVLLVSLLIERITGRPVAEAFRADLFAPAGLTRWRRRTPSAPRHRWPHRVPQHRHRHYTGGILFHTAMVAREFGIPAVVGTGDATSRLPDGQPAGAVRPVRAGLKSRRK
jgi:CubicO group peptidase (beta-lactamase class C family)